MQESIHIRPCIIEQICTISLQIIHLHIHIQIRQMPNAQSNIPYISKYLKQYPTPYH